MDEKLIQLFHESYEKDPVSECWLWKGIIANGYGNLSYKCENYRAHRLSYMIHRGKEIPENTMICHTCDVKNCVNPKHLHMGTATENQQNRSPKKENENRKTLLEKKRVGLLLNPKNYNELKKIAIDQHLTMNKLFDKMINEYVEKHQKKHLKQKQKNERSLYNDSSTKGHICTG